jgi:BMFP domain-containing protein YqiC
MTQTSNRIFDEMARLMNDAAGVAQGVRREVDTLVRTQAERILRDLDLVKREEFEAVKDMAALAREENEALNSRIDALAAHNGHDELAALKAQVEALAAQGLATSSAREELAAVKDMARQAREENAALKARIDGLEAKVAEKPSVAPVVAPAAPPAQPVETTASAAAGLQTPSAID